MPTWRTPWLSAARALSVLSVSSSDAPARAATSPTVTRPPRASTAPSMRRRRAWGMLSLSTFPRS